MTGLNNSAHISSSHCLRRFSQIFRSKHWNEKELEDRPLFLCCFHWQNVLQCLTIYDLMICTDWPLVQYLTHLCCGHMSVTFSELSLFLRLCAEFREKLWFAPNFSFPKHYILAFLHFFVAYILYPIISQRIAGIYSNQMLYEIINGLDSIQTFSHNKKSFFLFTNWGPIL